MRMLSIHRQSGLKCGKLHSPVQWKGEQTFPSHGSYCGLYFVGLP
jgi:hypothetical protein